MQLIQPFGGLESFGVSAVYIIRRRISLLYVDFNVGYVESCTINSIVLAFFPQDSFVFTTHKI